MQRRFLALAGISVLLAALLPTARGAGAEVPDFDTLAIQIDKELKPFAVRLAAVTDFRVPEKADSFPGHYFALLVSQALSNRANHRYGVANHPSFDDDLAKLHIVDPLGSDRTNIPVSPAIGADVLITGMISRESNAYLLSVTPVLVPARQSLPSLTARVRANELLDAMFVPFPNDIPLVNDRHSDEISLPSCLDCPDPPYSDSARRAKISGAETFQVVVSVEGQVSQIHPIKLLGYGLDEQAYAAIKTWRFKPAKRKKDGMPVPVAVPIEVTFRLF